MKHVVLQERDLSILAEVARSPACSRHQIISQFFEGRCEAAKKRLQTLSSAGLICNNDASTLGRTIIRLTKKGAEIVGGREQVGRAERQISSRMLRHEMLLSDCLASIRREAEMKEWFTEIATDEDLVTFGVQCPLHAHEERVTPDAVVALHSDRADYFFLEVDRGTETQEHLVHLAAQYRSLYRSGDFRPGNQAGINERPRMRVLFVMTSRARLKRTAHLLNCYAQIRTLIWLCHVDDFLKDPIGAGWCCPVDFENSSHPTSSRRLL